LNPARDCCVPTPTQRAIPPGTVNQYQRRLDSKRAYHAMHWPRRPIRSLAASAGVRLRAKETEISAALWALRLGKGHFIPSWQLSCCRLVTEERRRLSSDD